MKLPVTLDTPIGKLTAEGKVKEHSVYRGVVEVEGLKLHLECQIDTTTLSLQTFFNKLGAGGAPKPDEKYLVAAHRIVYKYLQSLDKTELMPKVAPIIPRADNVLLRQIREDEVTAGGIVIPDDARDRTFRGEVVAVGPGRPLPDGKFIPLDLVEGDEVIYARFSGIRLDLEGEDYVLVSERDIHGKVRKGVEA